MALFLRFFNNITLPDWGSLVFCPRFRKLSDLAPIEVSCAPP